GESCRLRPPRATWPGACSARWHAPARETPSAAARWRRPGCRSRTGTRRWRRRRRRTARPARDGASSAAVVIDHAVARGVPGEDRRGEEGETGEEVHLEGDDAHAALLDRAEHGVVLDAGVDDQDPQAADG